MSDDAVWMDRALQLAVAGWGRVHPNPMVGAVVVRDGVVMGEGHHAEFGGPHAEVAALRAAGDQARGGTLYVTLEPCLHHGKTPPCTQAIVDAGIARVVYASADPSAEARGGAAVLAECGVTVEGGVGDAEQRRLNVAFHHIHQRASPYVALKLAVSLDARLGEEAGRRSAVTGDEANAEVHRLRAGFDAILVGAGTAVADDPELTVRGSVVPRVPPIRVVLDSRARLSSDARMLRDRSAPVRVLTTTAADPASLDRLRAAGAQLSVVEAGRKGVDPGRALDLLWSLGVRSILCEGGGRLAASLLAGGHVHRLYLFVAPRFFGGRGAPAFPLDGPAGEWTLTQTRAVGRDTLLVLDLADGRS